MFLIIPPGINKKMYSLKSILYSLKKRESNKCFRIWAKEVENGKNGRLENRRRNATIALLSYIGSATNNGEEEDDL
jgi:hypothetical protein